MLVQVVGAEFGPVLLQSIRNQLAVFVFYQYVPFGLQNSSRTAFLGQISLCHYGIVPSASI